MTDLSQAIWRKARRSAHNGGCVEIAANLDGVTAVRDSKRPEGGAHVVGRDAFAAFLADREGRTLRLDVAVANDEKGPPVDAATEGAFSMNGPVSRPSG